MKWMLWTLPQFHLSTPPQKSELLSSGNLSSEPPLTLLLQTTKLHSPALLTTGFGLGPNNGEHRWEFGKSEDKKEGEGKCFFSLLWQVSPSGGQESFLASTGWSLSLWSPLPSDSCGSSTLVTPTSPLMPPAQVGVVSSCRCLCLGNLTAQLASYLF